MLLQNQTVYGTPIEALLRTSLMLFDLGYEDRLYKSSEGGVGHYKLVYVIFMLTAIAFSIFVINLLIGLAVGEIPSLMTQGSLWRTGLLYNLLSDYEIMRVQFTLFFRTLFSCACCKNGASWFIYKPYTVLQKDENVGPMGKLDEAGKYMNKHFFAQQIYDNIDKKDEESVEKQLQNIKQLIQDNVKPSKFSVVETV
ncbi:unnamed protein product [Rotaria sp. Silwood2]|nr:unnamed protein product [Rotaria sp. Silwood2]CAF4299468.1 unnamed protein product [Rotaria sp. Silwood2]